MKTKILAFMAIVAMTANIYAVDYSSMSIEELKALRGKVAPEDRAAFQTEMQKRVSTMTPEERASMRKSQSGAMNASGMQKGSGMGGGQGGGMGMGRNR